MVCEQRNDSTREINKKNGSDLRGEGLEERQRENVERFFDISKWNPSIAIHLNPHNIILTDTRAPTYARASSSTSTLFLLSSSSLSSVGILAQVVSGHH